MRWTVVSDRLPWERGVKVTDGDLDGTNVGALVRSGHLVPVVETVKGQDDPEHEE